LSEWVPAARGFFEVPRLGSEGLSALFTAAELAAMVQTGSLDILRLIIAILLVRRPVRATEPFFVDGVEAAREAGFLTSERAAQILAFQPHE
jgi:hypothetical protein